MTESQTETAIMGGGCFWCLEPCFLALQGVSAVESAYSGGHVENPTYEQVCTKQTGHVEVVKVTFDPAVISFEQILTVFFSIHDPTTKDRQGNDVGPQYRSVIYYQNDAQHEQAKSVISKLQADNVFAAPIVTEVAALTNYFPAERYHQNYFERNPGEGYCAFVVAPKVQKFRQEYAAKLK